MIQSFIINNGPVSGRALKQSNSINKLIRNTDLPLTCIDTQGEWNMSGWNCL